MAGTALMLEPARSAAPVAQTDLEGLAAAAAGYADASRASNTRRAYHSDLLDFSSWCRAAGLRSAPADAETVRLYLTARAHHLAVSTLSRRLSAIRAAHRELGLDLPQGGALDQTWAGIRRTHGRPPKKVRALRTDALRRVVGKLPPTLAGARDRALLLIGFAGALRRSELAALTLEGPDSGPVRASLMAEGLELSLDKSKGNQEGRREVVAVPRGRRPETCAAAALQAWLLLSGIRSGAVFRSIDRHGRMGEAAIGGRAVAEVVKRAVRGTGLSPADFSGHSLRRGLITSAADGGAPLDVLMRHARHARAETTLEYIEEAQRFKRSAAGKAGL